MTTDQTARLQRLYNLVAHLAHPKGDHCENLLEDEAHDIIREVRDLLIAQQARISALEQEIHARGVSVPGVIY